MTNLTLILIVSLIIISTLAIWLILQLIRLRQHLTVFEHDWHHREIEFEEDKRLAVEEAKKRSRTSQRNQIKGTLSERFTPFMGGFPYNPSDCRFLGEPVDFIIFNNLHKCADGLAAIEEVEVIIADVKTGEARLSQRQKILQYAIYNGQVRFETFRVSDDSINTLKVNIE